MCLTLQQYTFTKIEEMRHSEIHVKFFETKVYAKLLNVCYTFPDKKLNVENIEELTHQQH